MEPFVPVTLQFILIAMAAIVGIVWAMDIRTSKWNGFTRKPKTPSLLTILQRINGIPETQEGGATNETKPPARTYGEANTRMQEREETRTQQRTDRRHKR